VIAKRKIFLLTLSIRKHAPPILRNNSDVSRQFLYRQKDKAISAADDAFDETSDDNEKTLFHLPVTKAWLDQLAICLMLHGRTSF
jgi:hypothetical protein